MRKRSAKSVDIAENRADSRGADDGYLVPLSDRLCDGFKDSSAMYDGLMVPRWRKPIRRAHLDGNFARRKLPLRTSEYCIWDIRLPGFGLRIRPTGRYYWFVRLRQRGKHRRISLGCTIDVDADLARSQAKRLLAETALDGLPKRQVEKATPTLFEFVDLHWKDIARYWKPTTAERNWGAWHNHISPEFGHSRLGEITRADVVRWRDGCVGAGEVAFNRAVPVLSSLFKYAEQLGLGRKGSNPSRGIPRYKRPDKERFLSQLEYRRLGQALREVEQGRPAEVAIVRLLLYTGARSGEIRGLRWDWVRPPHLMLPDSKTGPKIIWLNSQAVKILVAIPRREDCPFVFPDAKGTRPLEIDAWWTRFRPTCGLTGVRIHDLRHSFASTAIQSNVPLTTIGKLLGHQLPETTAKYAHLSDDVISDAAQRVSGGLARAIGLTA